MKWAVPILLLVVLLGGWFSPNNGLNYRKIHYGSDIDVIVKTIDEEQISIVYLNSVLPFPHRVAVSYSYYPGLCGRYEEIENVDMITLERADPVSAYQDSAAIWGLPFSNGDSLYVTLTVLNADSTAVLDVITQEYVLEGPCITTVTGAISDGQSVAIDGTRFGVKDPAAPYVWDRIDNIAEHNAVTDGEYVPFGAGHLWRQSPADSLYNKVFRVGKSIKESHGGVGPRQEDVPFYYQGWKTAMSLPPTDRVAPMDSSYTHWFFNWWMWTDDTDTRSSADASNVGKYIRLYEAVGPYGDWCNGQSMVIIEGHGIFTVFDRDNDGCPDTYGGMCHDHIYNGGDAWNHGTLYTDSGEPEWVNAQVTINMDGSRQARGVGRQWMNNVACDGSALQGERRQRITQGTTELGAPVPSNQWGFSRVFDFGYDAVAMTGCPCPYQLREEHWGFSHIYIDTTFARVVVGNAESYDDCTHIEMQPPVSWALKEIAVTLNRGTFAAGDTSYVFVVDADGNVSTGKQVVWE